MCNHINSSRSVYSSMFCDLQMQALKMCVAKSMDKTPEFSWNVPVVLDLVDTLSLVGWRIMGYVFQSFNSNLNQ